MAAKKTAKKAAKASGKFTPEERAAMKERAAELKASALKEDGEAAILTKLATMPQPDRGLGETIHKIVRANAPDLTPRLWYGMPAYADGADVVCFFQNAAKFKTRYSTLGFSDAANLDAGSMWPSAFAILKLTSAEEAKIAALVKQAVKKVPA